MLTWQNRITRILVRDLMPHAEFSALVRESDKALCVVLLGVEFGNRGFLPFLRTGAHRHFEERRGVAPILPFLVLKKCGDRMDGNRFGRAFRLRSGAAITLKGRRI